MSDGNVSPAGAFGFFRRLASNLGTNLGAVTRGNDTRGHDTRGNDSRGHDTRGHDTRCHDTKGNEQHGGEGSDNSQTSPPSARGPQDPRNRQRGDPGEGDGDGCVDGCEGGDKCDKNDDKRNENINIPTRDDRQLQQYKSLFFQQPVLSMKGLTDLQWGGPPSSNGYFRSLSWKAILGLLPLNAGRREGTLKRKREEYWQKIREVESQEGGGTQPQPPAVLHPGEGSEGGERSESIPTDWPTSDPPKARTAANPVTLHQILVDLPRTLPSLPLTRSPLTVAALERVLYLWSLRNPATSYVQGKFFGGGGFPSFLFSPQYCC